METLLASHVFFLWTPKRRQVGGSFNQLTRFLPLQFPPKVSPDLEKNEKITKSY